jgi:hypothetical protein
MPWCPKCGAKYREGFKVCSDCNTDLVDHLEHGEVNSSDLVGDSEAYLTSVSNSIEAEMVEALLASSGIPVLKKFKGAGGYLAIYMGAVNVGVDLYVPSKLLVQARDILAKNLEIGAEIRGASGKKYLIRRKPGIS